MNTLLRRHPTYLRAISSATRVLAGSPIGMSIPMQDASGARATNASSDGSTRTAGDADAPSSTPTQLPLHQSMPRTTGAGIRELSCAFAAAGGDAIGGMWLSDQLGRTPTQHQP